jgi:hypothetical protein
LSYLYEGFRYVRAIQNPPDNVESLLTAAPVIIGVYDGRTVLLNITVKSRLGTLIGIGAAVPPPLPHHRAYGSVHGGSRKSSDLK